MCSVQGLLRALVVVIVSKDSNSANFWNRDIRRAMNRAKTVLAGLRIGATFYATRLSTTRPLCYQVTQFSSRLSDQFSATSHCFHQNLLFSSKPYSVVDLLMREDWSAELEDELGSYETEMTSPTVVYVLKKLEKDPNKAEAFFNWICHKKGFRPSASVYCLMLRVSAQSDSLKPFWGLLKEMKDQGIYIDEEVCNTISKLLKKGKKFRDAGTFAQFCKNMTQDDDVGGVVKKAAGVILGDDWNNEVKKVLGELELVSSDNLITRVLRELRNHPLKALSFFRWLGSVPGFEHSHETYSSILRVLAQNESIGEFWNMVEEMKDAGHEIDIDTYIKVSRQLQRFKMMEDAVKLYELMMDGPFKPHADHCSILLRSIAGCVDPNVDLVFRVSKKYEEIERSISKTVYDGIHRSLTSAGRFDEAENIVKAMRGAGYKPDNITYSQLVYGLCKAKRLEEACKVVLDDMEAQGCRPDVKTWTILIQGHFSANEIDKALQTYLKMVERKYDVDADLLDVLVHGLLSQERIEAAYQMLVETVDATRLTPWQATYKLLIGKLLEKKKFEEAMNLLRLMKQHNYPPFADPFTKYISKCGTTENAAEFLKALTVKESPTMTAYVNLFKAFIVEGRESEANDLLYKFPHHVRKHSKISELFS